MNAIDEIKRDVAATAHLCRDCKWRGQDFGWKLLAVFSWWSKTFWHDYIKHGTCEHPSARKSYATYKDDYTVVVGPEHHKSPLCVTERCQGNCGPDARLWEFRG